MKTISLEWPKIVLGWISRISLSGYATLSDICVQLFKSSSDAIPKGNLSNDDGDGNDNAAKQ